MSNLPNLDPNWPGLDPDPKKMAFDTDGIGDVARRLSKELEKFTGQDAGTPTDMQTKCANLTAQDFGQWDVGQTLTRASNDFYSAFHPKYVTFVQQLQAVIASLNKTAGNLDGAEGASTQTAQNAYNGYTGQPPATPPSSQAW